MTCPNCNGTLPDGAMFCGACGTRLAAAQADPLLDQVVGGRYRVLRRLGSGGMGRVYAAEQVSLKRPAALKLLNPELFEQPDIVRRFHGEAELAARLSHPHTVTIYDFGQAEDKSLFIAMELVTGESLRAVLSREGAMTPFRAIDIAEQVAASLWDAHQHGIVHRDLKPDNVMLSERAGRRDFVRVVDFGIAKLRDERAGGVTALPQTHIGSLLGTPQYMAPEQITGAPVDGRTDVYALGCMLYEMVTGRMVFNGQTLTAVLAQHLNEMPPPPDHVRPDLGVPPGLTGLIMRCIAKHPDARPATMEMVKAELATLRGQLGWGPAAGAVPTPMPPPPMPPPPMSPPPMPPPTTGDSRLWIGALAIGAVVIGAAVIIGRVQWQWDEEDPVPSSASETTDDDDQDDGETGPHGTVTPPSGSSGTTGSDIGLSDKALGNLFDEGLSSNPSGFGAKGKPSPAPGAGSGASVTNARFGYTLDLPAGFSTTDNSDQSTTALGTVAGQPAMIITFAQPADGSMFTKEALDTFSDSMVSGANARLVRKSSRRVAGQELVALIADMDQVGMRTEIVLFIRPSYLLAVAIGTQKASFESTAGLRDRFFGEGIRFR